MMLKEFVEKIVALGAPNQVQAHGLVYTDKPIAVVAKPTVSPVSLATLTGLCDLIAVRLDALDREQWLLHIVSPVEVSLIARQTDEYGRRSALATARLEDVQPFPFGRFLDREEFVIGLQARFVETPDRAGVLSHASSLTACTVAQAEDNGIAQSVTVRRGVTLKENVTVKGRVDLAPYRTFREVDQPISEFVFRLRTRDGGVPECALFEADGGKWRMDAMETIRGWLVEKELGIPVVA